MKRLSDEELKEIACNGDLPDAMIFMAQELHLARNVVEAARIYTDRFELKEFGNVYVENEFSIALAEYDKEFREPHSEV